MPTQKTPVRSGFIKAMDDIAQNISAMHFKKKVFGGVDEADVWRQIELLHKQYERAFLAMAFMYEGQHTHNQKMGDVSPNLREAHDAKKGLQ